jgi:cytochrome oxidase Cu insertion factor (SCO1/SenC/PrrC family)
VRILLQRLFAVFVVTLAVATPLGGGVVENVAPEAGKAAAPVSWLDETGGPHRLTEFTGYPVILLPVYTRCRTACVTNLGQLKAALAEAATDPTQFRVLLFSFDPTDTPAVLTRYRSRESIPLSWSIGTASKPDIAALLESIGFQYGQAGKEFTHPNLLVFLDRKLRVAKWIYGDNYTGREIDAAWRVAAGESDWVGQHSDVLYALLLFALTLCCVALTYYLLQLFASRRARPMGPSPTG